MKLARYVGGGRIEIRDEPEPTLPPGGLIVKTEASGLCSGELMDWYMERKVPHVLGHEVAGLVVESDDPRFPVGSRVAPHHHAACGKCFWCCQGKPVHCEKWKRSKLVPGGMAEYFAVPAENLIDTHVADDLRPQDGALMEPLGCVVKSTHLTWKREGPHYAVVGLGSLGIMHLLVLKALFNRYMVEQVVGVEISDKRRQWASDLGLKVVSPKEADKFDVVVLCPGTQMALDTAFDIVYPGGSIILFAPFAPDSPPVLNWDRLYFQEISLSPSYSCGAWECSQALRFLREGIVKAEQVVSHFIGIDELPEAYLAMKRGEILKAMVMFD